MTQQYRQSLEAVFDRREFAFRPPIAATACSIAASNAFGAK
jgi:hypothetical protein